MDCLLVQKPPTLKNDRQVYSAVKYWEGKKYSVVQEFS